MLSSAIPFMADVLALRRVAAGFFGVFMSVNPVLAALIGLVLLGQPLQWEEWLAVCAIVTANAVSVGNGCPYRQDCGARTRARSGGRYGVAGPAAATASPGRTGPAAPPRTTGGGSACRGRYDRVPATSPDPRTLGNRRSPIRAPAR